MELTLAGVLCMANVIPNFSGTCWFFMMGVLVSPKLYYCAQGRGTYGTRRLTPLWAPEGLQVSRRRIGRVLAQAGRHCTTRRRFQAPTAAGHAQTVAPHQLQRECTVQAPDTVSVGAMPYRPTGAGWLSLALVLALCSRAVVGWAMANPRRAAVVAQALA